MLMLTRAVRVFACAAPVDMRKGFDGLSARNSSPRPVWTGRGELLPFSFQSWCSVA
ncbi:transposase [Cystobacter ferrugineus]|uniref:transposase n=1 Tax=Cystobacter ferrugineus TaxID=83449 RepID=UPI000A78D9F2|nr:transposase [Cystobacter ferrugineus]